MLETLVDKNLQIIDEERKLREAMQHENENHKEARKLNGNVKVDLLYDRMIRWLETGKNYARKDITLEIVAKELNTNREYLSLAISNNNQRFNDLINKYRIDEAVRIISSKNDKRSKYNLQIIGSEVGFNSNSVFIAAFHKQTGLNPGEFRDSLKLNPLNPTQDDF